MISEILNSVLAPFIRQYLSMSRLSISLPKPLNKLSFILAFMYSSLSGDFQVSVICATFSS